MLTTLSWRRFLVLLSGLSQQSTLVISQAAAPEHKVITDPVEAERAVRRIW